MELRLPGEDFLYRFPLNYWHSSSSCMFEFWIDQLRMEFVFD